MNNLRIPIIWIPAARHEATRLLQDVWERLDKAQREALLITILGGPPRDLYRSDLTNEQWTEVLDNEVWTWLTIIKALEPNAILPSEAEAELKRIQSLHSNWKFNSWQAEGFVSGPIDMQDLPSASEVSANKLLAADWESLRDTLLNYPNRPELVESWREVSRRRPKRAAAALVLLARESKFPTDLWKACFQALPKFASQGALRIFRALDLCPETLLDEIVDDCVLWLDVQATGILLSHEPALLDFWFRLAPIAEKRPANAHPDFTMAATHPFGSLTDVLVKRFWKHSPRTGSKLGALEKAFSRVSDSTGDGGVCGRLIMAALLHPLFLVDPAWTKEHFLKYFAWSNQDASSVWDGYLRAPHMSVGLLVELKSQFLSAFQKLAFLHNRANLAVLLVAIGVYGTGDLNREEARSAIRALGADEKREAAAWIYRITRPPPKSDGAPDDASNRERIFSERVLPWLSDVWPRELSCNDSAIAFNIALACIYSGEAFGRAVSKLRFFWIPLREMDLFAPAVAESGNPEAFPSEVLDLLDRLMPQDVSHFAGIHLSNVLERIAKVSPSARDDSRFIRIMDAVLKSRA